jgi:hypothetical protein
MTRRMNYHGVRLAKRDGAVHVSRRPKAKPDRLPDETVSAIRMGLVLDGRPRAAKVTLPKLKFMEGEIE